MTAFEVVFSLLTMLTSLALAHLLSGFVLILKNSDRVRFSLLHGLWSWIAFAVPVGNWASFWEMRMVESWPALAVLLIVVAATIQYAFCALVTPEMPSKGELDLGEFHSRVHRKYMLAMILLLSISLVLNLVLGGLQIYGSWSRDTVLTFAPLLVLTVAFLVRARWVQIGASVLLAAIATYYMVITCNVVAA